MNISCGQSLFIQKYTMTGITDPIIHVNIESSITFMQYFEMDIWGISFFTIYNLAAITKMYITMAIYIGRYIISI